MVLDEQEVGVTLIDLNEFGHIIQGAVPPSEVGCKGVDIASNYGADPTHLFCDTDSPDSCAC
jgi:hypothetical protein